MRRQALGSGLVGRAPAAPAAGRAGSGEGGSPRAEEGWRLETLGGQGLLVCGWLAPGQNNDQGHGPVIKVEELSLTRRF